MFNWVGLLPVVSNLWFILPAVRAFLWGNHGLTVSFGLVLFTSTSYHLCKHYSMLCLFEYSEHLKLDFVLAFVALPLLSFNFIYWPRRYRYWSWWCYLMSFFSVALLVSFVEPDILVQSIIVISSFVIIVTYWSIFYYIHRKLPYYNWNQLVMGLGCSFLGVAFFLNQNFYPEGYPYLHFMWHTLVAIGSFFFIGSKRIAPHWLNLAQDINFNHYGGNNIYKMKTSNNCSMSKLELGMFFMNEDNNEAKLRLIKDFGEQLRRTKN